MSKIIVKVPATSANIGSGFDCMGIAFNLYNTFEFEKLDSGVKFCGFEERFQNETNLAYIAYKKACEKIGANPYVKITDKETCVPVARGLGSSATLICAGVYAANKLNGSKLSDKEMLEICTELEGHPDNVAPALFGGLCSSVIENGVPYTVKFKVSDKLHFTLLIPDFEVKTSDARAVLPKLIERSDAIYNMSRTSLLPYAFENGDIELIKIVTKDKLHENYRKKLFRNIDDIEKAAYRCGAVSFVISGAGSTCMAISDSDISEKLRKEIENLPNDWKSVSLQVVDEGTLGDYYE